MKKYTRRLITVLIFIFLTNFTSLNQAYSFSSSGKEKDIKIMFIGNSMTMSGYMPYMLQQIAKSKGKNLTIDVQSGLYGTYLKEHWTVGLAEKAIIKGDYAYVSLQDSNFNNEYYKYVNLFDELIDKSGQKLFYMISRLMQIRMGYLPHRIKH